MYEGEVIELSPEETENQMGGYGKVISHVIIGLKSVKGAKQLKLDPSIFDSLQKEKVQVGRTSVWKVPAGGHLLVGVHSGLMVETYTQTCSCFSL